MDQAELSAMIQDGLTLEQIANSVDRHPSTVSYWLKKHGLKAVNSEKHRARGGIDRSELEALVNDGLSITELAETLDRSKATIRHWLQRYDLKTVQATRRAQRRAVLELSAIEGSEPPRELVMQCREHGETTFVREGSGYYRCARCRSESVVTHRRRLRAQLVAEAGGRCVLCGYDRQPRALSFHHLDPTVKQFGLSQRGITLSLASLRAEAQKCVLLCSNCHMEVEAGHVTVPIQ